MGQDDVLLAERKVLEQLGEIPLDFRAIAVISTLFRASVAIRRSMESKVLAADRLSWTSFVVLWVVWVWGEMESRDLAAAVGIGRPTSTERGDHLEERGWSAASATRRGWSGLAHGRGEAEDRGPVRQFNREESALTAHLSGEEQERMAGMLRSMLRAVEQDLAWACA